MENKISFEERVQRMTQAAHDLRGIAEFVAEEAIHMAAASERFAARKATRPPKQTASR